MAKEFIPEFDRLEQEEVRFRRSMRPFCLEDLKKADLVIAAANDIELNRTISRWCKQRKIPVNSVQGPEDSSFLFPSLFTDGPVTVPYVQGVKALCWPILLKERIPIPYRTSMENGPGFRSAAQRDEGSFSRFRRAGGVSFPSGLQRQFLIWISSLHQRKYRHCWLNVLRPCI